MDKSFIGKRITELRLARNISEYHLSLELGMSKGYIQGITSGKCLPSVDQLFNIADYFNMTLSEFFDEGITPPPAVQSLVKELRQMDEADAELFLPLVRRLKNGGRDHRSE